jgi:hypothetical protein
MSSREQPTRGSPPAWGLGLGLTSPHRKNVSRYEMFQHARTWTDSLARLNLLKKDMRYGTWNVRSLCSAGTIKSVVGELEKYKLDLVGRGSM